MASGEKNYHVFFTLFSSLLMLMGKMFFKKRFRVRV
jgi:hypothetical protein